MGEVVLDSEVVVAAADGRANTICSGARMHGKKDVPQASFYVLDAVRVGDVELVERP